jgi:hypothetical protein
MVRIFLLLKFQLKIESLYILELNIIYLVNKDKASEKQIQANIRAFSENSSGITMMFTTHRK